jgi:hypothetical protein
MAEEFGMERLDAESADDPILSAVVRAVGSGIRGVSTKFGLMRLLMATETILASGWARIAGADAAEAPVLHFQKPLLTVSVAPGSATTSRLTEDAAVGPDGELAAGLTV